jgi:adenosylcobinamide amidohydrolase
MKKRYVARCLKKCQFRHRLWQEGEEYRGFERPPEKCFRVESQEEIHNDAARMRALKASLGKLIEQYGEEAVAAAAAGGMSDAAKADEGVKGTVHLVAMNKAQLAEHARANLGLDLTDEMTRAEMIALIRTREEEIAGRDTEPA